MCKFSFSDDIVQKVIQEVDDINIPQNIEIIK